MTHPEMPNIITLLADRYESYPLFKHLVEWETIIFSIIAVSILSFIAISSSRNLRPLPGRLQASIEMLVGGFDDFTCGILGPKGRKLTPFIGTLFIYILFMNLLGIVPLMKSSTSSWSITLALALSVFFYLQYTSIRELGLRGWIDHLMGNPRGILAASVIMPVFMLFMHVTSELIRPISLSLRLRSNIWGEDMLLAVLAGFGLKGLPLLLFSTLSSMLASIVQAGVFCLLTTIYFALVLSHEEAH